MRSGKIFLRILKFLGKAILGLVLILTILIALIHIPAIQRQITHKLSDYLSSKTKARIAIQNIKFSISGKVAIENLQVWDPDNNKIFSARKIEVASGILSLVNGDLVFDEIHLEGITGKLIEREDGLNIQFIMDAFQSNEEQTAESGGTKLLFTKILLEDIGFQFTSTVSGLTLAMNLGKFMSQEAEFSMDPDMIRVDAIYLQHTAVNVLSAQQTDTVSNSADSINNKYFIPDFGTGFIFDIKSIVLEDNDFSFHTNQVANTPKFDPGHLALKNININVSDILIREDTLAAVLQSLSVKLPGFTVTDVGAAVKLNRNRLALTRLHFASGTNELHADLKAGYDLKSAAADNLDAEIAAHATINPGDLAYFFSDSVMNYFNGWGTSEAAFEGSYMQGKGEIKMLNLKTANSQLQAEGTLYEVMDIEKLSWKDVLVRISVGPDFSKVFSPFAGTVKIPPDLTVQAKSTGSLKKVMLDGKIVSDWGDITASGMVAKQVNNVNIDVSVTGERVALGKYLDLPWLGHVDLSVDAKGIIGHDQDAEIKGLISSIEVQGQPIHDIAFQSRLEKANATAIISIEDPKYRLKTNSEISFAGPLIITNSLELDSFNLGRLLKQDSTLLISGDLKSKIKTDKSSMEGSIEGKDMVLQNDSTKYLLDSLVFNAIVSPAKSGLEYYTDYAKANLDANFDVRDFPGIIKNWSKNIINNSDNSHHPTGNRALNFNFQLKNASPFLLLGINIDDFSSIDINGAFDEQKQKAVLRVSSGKFKGYGVALDTLSTNLTALQDSVTANMNVKNLYYNTTRLGNLDAGMFTTGDTTVSNLLLSRDSIAFLDLRARILRGNNGIYIYPDKLLALEKDFLIDPKNPLYIKNGKMVLDSFMISRDDMQISLSGDSNAFNAGFKNLNFTSLNSLISPDSAVINNGRFSGMVSYVRDYRLELNANIDSLSLYNSDPLSIAVTAKREENRLLYKFLLTNPSNKIDINGVYFLDNKEVDASLLLDVNDPKLFSVLYAGVFDDISGSIKGEAKVSGSIEKPVIKGYIKFPDAGFVTSKPKLNFYLKDDVITFDNSGLLFDNFKIYDREQNLLTISGNLSTKDYKSFAYDLNINTDNYALIDNPDSVKGPLKGQVIIGCDVALKGDEKDTYIKSKITIKDSTDFTFVMSDDDNALLKTEGIVDFIDPGQLDSAGLEASVNYYDSLIASLPDFNLNSTITIEDNATIRIITDEQSGDFFESTGGAKLELGYDRTGNARLAGTYTISKGVYRLSFYNLVKKSFNIVKGSSISWSGSPEDGEMDIKAAHTVASNSIGLFGDEIGENEKSVYKRSLDYEVGIIIKGTLEKPVVSFSLDLPKKEKANYPALANKLDRLKLPEFQSELNKQVFGLLVLGGFLPETSGSDIDQTAVATTALYNSVNSLLASQLNRFASQYIKRVNVEVGLQSYSDYSTPGGQTQTAMDFRVSKSVMNDRLSFEIGGEVDINSDQSGANTGNKSYRGDIAIIYDLTGKGNKQLKLFNNETYDIIYQEIRNTGISLIFLREFDKNKKGEEPK